MAPIFFTSFLKPLLIRFKNTLFLFFCSTWVSNPIRYFKRWSDSDCKMLKIVSKYRISVSLICTASIQVHNFQIWLCTAMRPFISISIKFSNRMKLYATSRISRAVIWVSPCVLSFPSIAVVWWTWFTFRQKTGLYEAYSHRFHANWILQSTGMDINSQ